MRIQDLEEINGSCRDPSETDFPDADLAVQLRAHPQGLPGQRQIYNREVLLKWSVQPQARARHPVIAPHFGAVNGNILDYKNTNTQLNAAQRVHTQVGRAMTMAMVAARDEIEEAVVLLENNAMGFDPNILPFAKTRLERIKDKYQEIIDWVDMLDPAAIKQAQTDLEFIINAALLDLPAIDEHLGKADDKGNRPVLNIPVEAVDAFSVTWLNDIHAFVALAGHELLSEIEIAAKQDAEKAGVDVKLYMERAGVERAFEKAAASALRAKRAAEHAERDLQTLVTALDQKIGDEASRIRAIAARDAAILAADHAEIAKQEASAANKRAAEAKTANLANTERTNAENAANDAELYRQTAVAQAKVVAQESGTARLALARIAAKNATAQKATQPSMLVQALMKPKANAEGLKQTAAKLSN